MSATESKSVLVDRDMLVELIARVDGLATYETYRGGCETPYTECVYRITEPLEHAVFGPMTDEQSEAATLWGGRTVGRCSATSQANSMLRRWRRERSGGGSEQTFPLPRPARERMGACAESGSRS
jgi:hypothetical protein